MRESANTINQQQLQPIHIIELFIVAQTVLAGKQHSRSKHSAALQAKKHRTA
jgi:hypothetical protein